jgi:hypothetical protein
MVDRLEKSRISDVRECAGAAAALPRSSLVECPGSERARSQGTIQGARPDCEPVHHQQPCSAAQYSV